jgi:hypothetical protein
MKKGQTANWRVMQVRILTPATNYSWLNLAAVSIYTTSCGALPDQLHPSTWYNVVCVNGGYSGSYIKIDTNSTKIHFCGIKVYGYQT